MRAACLGLMDPSPGRPVECVGDGVVVGIAWVELVEEFAYFGDCEVDQSSVNGAWCVGLTGIC